MSEIGKFLTEFVTPTAREFGFRRRGQKFVREDDHGNLALLACRRPRFRSLFDEGSVELVVHEIFCLVATADYRRILFNPEIAPVEVYGKVWVNSIDAPNEVHVETEEIVLGHPWMFRTQRERGARRRIASSCSREGLPSSVESNVRPEVPLRSAQF